MGEARSRKGTVKTGTVQKKREFPKALQAKTGAKYESGIPRTLMSLSMLVWAVLGGLSKAIRTLKA